jgi:hypothetical protein
MIDLTNFRVDPRKQLGVLPDTLFGSGWSNEAFAPYAGWMSRATKSGKCAVVGRPGVPGCISVMWMGGKLDVLTYDELDGPTVYRMLHTEKPPMPDVVQQVTPTPGWFLALLDAQGNLR